MNNVPRRRLLVILGGAAILIGALVLLAWASKKAQKGSAAQAASADAMFNQAGGEPAGNTQLFLTILNPGNPTNGSNGGPIPPQPAPGPRPLPGVSTGATAGGLIRPRVNPSSTMIASSASSGAAHASAPLMLLHSSINGGPIPPQPAPGSRPIPPQPGPGRRPGLRRLPPVAPPVNTSAA